MGNQTATPSEAECVKLFWQERPIKYSFEGGKYQAEEVQTPWDLFVEGEYFQHSIGSEIHQVLVKNKMERIFSIRSTDKGTPVCTIITKPQDAPLTNLKYGVRRVFNSDVPMTIDGEQLTLLEIIADRGTRAPGPILRLAKDFYLSQGGVLTEEHPNGLAFKDHKVMKRWREIMDAKGKPDIIISSKLPNSLKVRVPPLTAHASNLEVALILLRASYWDKCYINGEEDWLSEVATHMEKNSEDQPNSISMFSEGSPRSQALLARFKLMWDTD